MKGNKDEKYKEYPYKEGSKRRTAIREDIPKQIRIGTGCKYLMWEMVLYERNQIIQAQNDFKLAKFAKENFSIL